MAGPNLLAACAAKGMRTPCDHPAYCDGKCVVVDFSGHLSYNNDGRRPLDMSNVKYIHAADSNHGFTLQTIHRSHRWSDAGDEFGQTLCVQRRNPTCRAAGLTTPCDHPSWNNGQCGHMSYAANNDFPRDTIAYTYWYAGNSNGVASIQNIPGSHRWASPCDNNGVAFCVKPIPVKDVHGLVDGAHQIF